MKKAENTQEKLAMTVIEKYLMSLPGQSILALVIAVISTAKEYLNLHEIAMSVLGQPNNWQPKMWLTSETISTKTKTMFVERQITNVNFFAAYPISYSETTTTTVYCKNHDDAEYIKTRKYLPSNKEFKGEISEEYFIKVTLKETRSFNNCNIEQWERWENEKKKHSRRTCLVNNNNKTKGQQ